jgi:hypothetical protein
MYDDFILIPSARDFTVFSLEDGSTNAGQSAPTLRNGEIRHGVHEGPPDVRMLVGYCSLGSPDAALLVSLLPELVHTFRVIHACAPS